MNEYPLKNSYIEETDIIDEIISEVLELDDILINENNLTEDIWE